MAECIITHWAASVCLWGPFMPTNCAFARPIQVITPHMQQLNKSMSKVRISAEWLFNDIINYYFKFVDFKKISRLP